jgi:hypothetical protein
MEPDAFLSQLDNLADALQRWINWLPGDRDAAEHGNSRGFEFEFHEMVDIERLGVLATLGADRHGYLAELIDAALTCVVDKGKDFVANCSGMSSPNVKYWQDVALAEIVRLEPACKGECVDAVLELMGAFYGCLRVFVAVAAALRQKESPNSDHKQSPNADQADILKERLTPQMQDLVDAVRETGHRITGDEIRGVLAKKGKVVSVGTTSIYLAALTRAGILTNRQDVRPRGYALPEWGSSI